MNSSGYARLNRIILTLVRKFATRLQSGSLRKEPTERTTLADKDAPWAPAEYELTKGGLRCHLC